LNTVNLCCTYCGKLLADLGQVIKVEKPVTGDRPRKRPFPRINRISKKVVYFLYLNTNKRGGPWTSKSAGRKVFQELVKWPMSLSKTTPSGFAQARPRL